SQVFSEGVRQAERQQEKERDRLIWFNNLINHVEHSETKRFLAKLRDEGGIDNCATLKRCAEIENSAENGLMEQAKRIGQEVFFGASAASFPISASDRDFEIVEAMRRIS